MLGNLSPGLQLVHLQQKVCEMDDVFNKYQLESIAWIDRNQKILSHSKTVAVAAQTIAAKISTLDPDLAYEYGLMHDIGKFYLSKEEKYKHPSLGYEMMLARRADIATICITHPFPNVELNDYIWHYCGKDEKEVEKILSYLANVEYDDYVQLIQFCDKICGINGYVTLDYKFKWYADNYPIDNGTLSVRYEKYMDIKERLDNLAKIDTYNLFHFQKTL